MLALPQLPRWGGYLAGAVVGNAILGAILGAGKPTVAIAFALLPALAVALGALLAGRAYVLVCIALALEFTNTPLLTEPLPLGGSIAIYASDVILVLAVMTWAAAELIGGKADWFKTRPRPLTLGWPLAAFAVFVAYAIIQGNEHYGTTFFGQPVRLIVYAAIAVAVIDSTAADLWRGITFVFYAGALTELGWALFYLAAGGSQTDSLALSTGGTRILALGTATYLGGSLVCALLNLERSRERFAGQVWHALVAGAALFGIVVAFGRTTYAAMAIVLPALLVARRGLRQVLARLLPALLPVLVIALLLIPLLDPSIVSTTRERISASPATDINVEWRDRGRQAALVGIDDHLLTGFGFGRPVRFYFLGTEQDLTGDPHNSYVYLLAGGGILALGALLALMAAFVADVLRRLRRAVGVEQSLLIWALSTWFVFMVNAFYGPVLSDSTMLMTIWILMVIPWAVPLQPTPTKQTSSLNLGDS